MPAAWVGASQQRDKGMSSPKTCWIERHAKRSQAPSASGLAQVSRSPDLRTSWSDRTLARWRCSTGSGRSSAAAISALVKPSEETPRIGRIDNRIAR